MRSRLSILLLAVLAAFQLAPGCNPNQKIAVDEPPIFVGEFSFPVKIRFVGDFDLSTVAISINGTSILGELSAGPVYTGTIDPGAPLKDFNFLVASGFNTAQNKVITVFRPLTYLPPGKARARKIYFSHDLIKGPLAHSQKGDYLLKNGVARFVIQDVAQRELYSVGQYGGNIIDAELVGNTGKDNFIELQTGLNIETVLNAQTIEIVNDGADGTAAILRTCGPDDLLDFVNPSSQVTDIGLPFPALADDHDLEITGCNEYTLEPNKSFVRIDTEVFNNETVGPDPDPVPLFVGDWLNPAGELHTFERPIAVAPPGLFNPLANGVGPPVASVLGTLGFFGFDEAAGTDYSYTSIPLDPPNDSVGTTVFISGVLIVLHSQNALLSLLGLDTIHFNVARGGSEVFTRFFGVGDGSGSSAVDLENEVKGIANGTVEGCVTVAGTPVAQARVSVGSPLATGLGANSAASDKLASAFTTRPGACPNYSGTVAVGAYDAVAGLDGHLYQGGTSVPPLTALVVSANTTTTVNFDLPAAGSLRVEVTDESGSPTPARVTVVGFDPSPERVSAGPSLPGFGGGSLGLLNDQTDALPFGIVAVGYADSSGVAEFDLEPQGTDPNAGEYHVYVSRGTEYSVWRTASSITISAGVQTAIATQISRVVDTTGFISSDFHVHGIRSADSRISDVHRVEAYSAEGVENVVMTDHHVHTDLKPAIAAAGLGGFLTATIGEEITTFDYGHFNAYPLLIDEDSPHGTFDPDTGEQLSGGSTDWAQAAPPGEDFPSFGNFNATPSVIHALATAGALSIPGVTTIQANHISSHFQPLKIDTSLVPPADGMSDSDRANRRLPDTTAVPNLFQHFPALELWNGDNRGSQSDFLDERIGIWFNHLNQGLPTTLISDTDSHHFTNLNTAGARTWTASPTGDAPNAIDPADVAAAVDAGRAVGGQGIYVQTRLLATDGSGDVADLTAWGSTSMTDAAGNVDLEITIQSPRWAEWDTVEVYRNAPTFSLESVNPADSPYLFGATPDVVLDEGDCDPTTTGDGAFDVTVTSDVNGVAGADLISTTLVVPYVGLATPTWFVVVVKGTDGECAPMFPAYPDNLATGSNATLADLVDGNLGESGVLALGATNALYFAP